MKLTQGDEGEIRALLVGRSIVKVTGSDTLHLDDGTTLKIEGNSGCGGCPNGNFWLEELNQTPVNAIMNVEFDAVDLEAVDIRDAPEAYRIFVLAENRRIKLAEVQGDTGNGYYGTGYWIEVSRA